MFTLNQPQHVQEHCNLHPYSAGVGRMRTRRRVLDRRFGPLMIGAVLSLTVVACSSPQPGVKLIDVLEHEAVIEELRYDAIGALDTTQQGPAQIVLLDVEEFVSRFVISEEGWPSWLTIDESISNTTKSRPDDETHVGLDWLHRYMPPNIEDNSGAYVWSLYWALAMPPAQVQLEILTGEFGGTSRTERDVDGFRSRYPEYLEELARAWLDINSEHRPEWLRIE